jgi:hypothetical protein
MGTSHSANVEFTTETTPVCWGNVRAETAVAAKEHVRTLLLGKLEPTMLRCCESPCTNTAGDTPTTVASERTASAAVPENHCTPLLNDTPTEYEPGASGGVMHVTEAADASSNPGVVTCGSESLKSEGAGCQNPHTKARGRSCTCANRFVGKMRRSVLAEAAATTEGCITNSHTSETTVRLLAAVLKSSAGAGG